MIETGFDPYIFTLSLLVDKSTTRFTPTIAKGRRHSAPAARAGLSVNNAVSKNASKGITRSKAKEPMSEPERKLKSADKSFFGPIGAPRGSCKQGYVYLYSNLSKINIKTRKSRKIGVISFPQSEIPLTRY
jgi:hypothetical protein